MNEKEAKIKEARTIEATRKNLMGISGKFGVILRNIGHPLVAQGEFMSDIFGYSSSTSTGQNWGEEEFDELPTMEVLDAAGYPIEEPFGDEWTQKKGDRVSGFTSNLGWSFDGLSRGVHMDMKYLKNNSELVVNYKGYKVYHEANGELNVYTPNDEWENKVDQLFVSAKKLDEKNRKIDKVERIEEAKKEKKSWVQKLKDTWGI